MKRKTKSILLAGALAGVLTVGSVTAYLTDADAATGNFTYGKVSLDLMQPSWDPDNGENITPGLVIPQDPQIKNDGENPEFVFIEVQVPYENMVVSDEQGNKQSKAYTPMFTYTAQSDWTLIDTDSDESTKTETRRYVYGTADECTELAPGSTTSALYEEVVTALFVEDQGYESTADSIELKAYGIQINNLTTGETTDPEEVWSIIDNQTPSQDKDSEDPATDILL